jgi:hypothetical protein
MPPSDPDDSGISVSAAEYDIADVRPLFGNGRT